MSHSIRKRGKKLTTRVVWEMKKRKGGKKEEEETKEQEKKEGEDKEELAWEMRQPASEEIDGW